MRLPVVTFDILLTANIGIEKIEFNAYRYDEETAHPEFFSASFDDSTDFSVLKKELKELISDAIIVGYNTLDTYNFFLNKLNLRFANPVIDAKDLIILFYPDLDDYTLLSVVQKLDLSEDDIFSSASRAELIYDLLMCCWNKGLKLDLGFFDKAHDYLSGLNIKTFFELLQKEILKTYPDRKIRTGLALKEDLESWDYAEQQDNMQLYSKEWVLSCFREKGLLEKSLEDYESRKVQEDMASVITDNFLNAETVVIEAGTGTGKTLAYLIPSIWWTKKHGKKTVISTQTITLQEQVFYKELPFLQKILPFTFETALLKGKNNYCCLKKLDLNSPRSKELAEADRFISLLVLMWLRTTTTGDLSELPNIPETRCSWSDYNAENLICEPARCNYNKECFFLRAKKKSEKADLLIINHSLLLSDIKTEHRVLPNFTDLIIDEAHNLYASALKQFGTDISYEQIMRIINEFIGANRNNFVASFLKQIPKLKHIFPEIDWIFIKKCLDDIPELCIKIKEQALELNNLFKTMLAGRTSIRVSENNIPAQSLDYFTVALENMLNRVMSFLQVLNKIYKAIPSDSISFENIKYDIIKNVNELEELVSSLRQIIDCNEQFAVNYLEHTGTIHLKHCPIDIAPLIKESIFDKNNSTVLTSATLSIRNSFNYITKDLGLSNANAYRFLSPFNYDEQLDFCIVRDINLNNESGYDNETVAKVSQLILDTAEILQGKTLVLFTSYNYMNKVYNYLNNGARLTDIQPLAQGIDGTRESLLARFSVDPVNKVLLGTNSFWEGIDIRGENLSCVIMVKLPFWAPNMPIIEARSDLLKRQGLDPFTNLFLPEAVIRFKQGFGRLIRSKKDKGYIILLDDRILNKNYGRSFIESLPISAYYSGDMTKVVEMMRNNLLKNI